MGCTGVEDPVGLSGRTSTGPSLRLGPSRCRRGHRDTPAVLADPLVHHLALDQREEGVVATLLDADAGPDVAAALADQDGPRRDGLAPEHLDAQTLGVGVSTVAGGAAALLVRHQPVSSAFFRSA